MGTKRLGTKIAALTVLCFVAGYFASKRVPVQNKPLPMLLVKSYSGTIGANYPEALYNSFPVKALQTVVINVDNTNVQIRKSNSQNISVTLQGKYFNVKPPHHMLINQSTSNQLILKTNELNTASHVNFEGQMIVTLPENIKAVTLQSKQGNLMLCDLQLNALNASTISGNIKTVGTFKKLSLATNSGDLTFKGNASQIVLNTLRGNSYLALLNSSPEMKINSNSGDIKINFAAKPDLAIDFVTVSGNLIYKDTKVKNMPLIIGTGEGKATINTISGDLAITQEGQ